jgi:hypothetical protein
LSKPPRKLDLNSLLRAIDRCDGDWLDAQPEDARKEFKPLVAMRFAASLSNDGIDAAYLLLRINDRVNRHLFDLPADLAFRLLASCGRKRPLPRQWLAGPKHTMTANDALKLLAEHHPGASDAELRLLLSLYNREEFASFLDACGLTREQSKSHLAAYDKLG